MGGLERTRLIIVSRQVTSLSFLNIKSMYKYIRKIFKKKGETVSVVEVSLFSTPVLWIEALIYHACSSRSVPCFVCVMCVIRDGMFSHKNFAPLSLRPIPPRYRGPRSSSTFQSSSSRKNIHISNNISVIFLYFRNVMRFFEGMYTLCKEGTATARKTSLFIGWQPQCSRRREKERPASLSVRAI